MNTTPSDTGGRLINGAVVVAVIITTAIVLVHLAGLTDAAKTALTPLFGSFTTLVGTAIAAYFGISAARESSRDISRHADTAIAATKENASLREQLATFAPPRPAGS